MSPGYFEIGSEVRYVVFGRGARERALVGLNKRVAARVKPSAPRTRS